MTIHRYILVQNDATPEKFWIYKGYSAVSFEDDGLRDKVEDLEQLHFQESLPLPAADALVSTGGMGDNPDICSEELDGSEG